MDDHENRRREVAELVSIAYTLTAKILDLLPIPISIPVVIDREWGAGEASQALIRSQALVIDLPIEDEVKTLIYQMILDWQVALAFAALDQARPSRWRLDCAEYAVARLEAQAEVVTEKLTAGTESE